MRFTLTEVRERLREASGWACWGMVMLALDQVSEDGPVWWRAITAVAVSGWAWYFGRQWWRLRKGPLRIDATDATAAWVRRTHAEGDES